MTLLAAALLFLQSETSWEQRSARLLKDHPRDPAVLMLCLDRKDLDGHRKLGAMHPSPMVLSHVVNALLPGKDDPAVRAEVALLASAWAEKDPGNGYPRVILAGLKAAGGDLPGALVLLEDAARGKWFRSYAAESRTAVVAMLKEKGVADLMALWHAGGGWRGSFEMSLIHASRILGGCGEEEEYRGRLLEAERWVAALLEIGRRISEDPAGDSIVAASIVLGPAAEQAYRIALRRRRPAEAGRCAELSRAAFRSRESMSRAVKAFHQTDPLGKYLMESDLDYLSMAGAALNPDPKKLQEFYRKLETKLREKEGMIRPILESGVALGEKQRILRTLPDEDRKAIAAMKTPIDHLVAVADAFFPEKYGPQHRARLVELANHRTENDYEASDLIRGVAFWAILHHEDKEAASALGAYLKGSLGDASPEVVETLKESLKDDGLPENYRVLARLGLKDCAPDLLRLLKTSMADRGFHIAIPAAYALRDLTGKDFGLDVARWEAFAKDQPAIFRK